MSPAHKFALSTLFLTCAVSKVHSAIWSYVLSNPLPINPDEERLNITNNRVLIRCSSDDHCGQVMFCDTHYGYCDTQRRESEQCREDRHCMDRLVCMFGKCQRSPPPGHQGARCESSSDCRRGMCCARSHGERICKPNLPLGHKCYVPPGGLDYILNEQCPCNDKLVCKNVGSHKKREEEFGLWNNYEHMRCATPDD
ncbi:dickkopf-related protein 3-like [Ornithodoros turicata]|uniref:dickkopf-related protein 3-like n=1 Tax=Ornithodoros turicata TaxID=34597 RepID=UPI003138B8C8